MSGYAEGENSNFVGEDTQTAPEHAWEIKEDLALREEQQEAIELEKKTYRKHL